MNGKTDHPDRILSETRNGDSCPFEDGPRQRGPGFGRTGEADARYSRRNFKAGQQGFCRWSPNGTEQYEKDTGSRLVAISQSGYPFLYRFPDSGGRRIPSRYRRAVRGADCRQLCQCGCVGLPRIRLQGIGREIDRRIGSRTLWRHKIGHRPCPARSCHRHVVEPATRRSPRQRNIPGRKKCIQSGVCKRSVYSQYTTCGSRNPLGKRYSEKNGRQRRNRNRRRHLPHENGSRYFFMRCCARVFIERLSQEPVVNTCRTGNPVRDYPFPFRIRKKRTALPTSSTCCRTAT